MAPSVATLYGDGVSSETLAQIAAAHQMGLANGTDCPSFDHPENCGILLIDTIDPEKLAQQMQKPYTAYIEMIGEKEPINAEIKQGIAEGKLCFSFATNTAYQMDSAALICDALVARGVLSPIKRGDVELSLHETISNAVVHGNLCLESNMKGNMGNFAEFAKELQTRMSSPEARRRVDIMASWDSEFLDISVADKGNGYDETQLPANVDPFAPAGRGLAIIRSLTLAMNVTHGGRVTTLRFVT